MFKMPRTSALPNITHDNVLIMRDLTPSSLYDTAGCRRRDRSSCPITICLYPEELDAFAPDQVGALARYEELGITRCIVGLNPEKRDAILPVLDRWAKFIRPMKA
jgi:hypothetical protein